MHIPAAKLAVRRARSGMRPTRPTSNSLLVGRSAETQPQGTDSPVFPSWDWGAPAAPVRFSVGVSMTGTIDLSEQFVDDYRSLEDELERLRAARTATSKVAVDAAALVSMQKQLAETAMQMEKCRTIAKRLQEELRREKRDRREAERALAKVQPRIDD